ncbi:ScpA family protein [Streptomyces sp. ISL-100]|uniref:segregation and condensation protein A n=1 Tax=Streptomyces sp. ISL-100 TaxID=2819173 RepID=UPI001BE7D927|nr:ScpA family protein [Streptomyces sp. ISL-100]MBT2399602.1 segregation/condensation protein A [Streptomyces sp. ISL-100]
MQPTDDSAGPDRPASAPRRRLGRGPGASRAAGPRLSGGPFTVPDTAVPVAAPDGASGPRAGGSSPTPPLPETGDKPPAPQAAGPSGTAPVTGPATGEAGSFGAAPVTGAAIGDAGSCGAAPVTGPATGEADSSGAAAVTDPATGDPGSSRAAAVTGPAAGEAGSFGAVAVGGAGSRGGGFGGLPRGVDTAGLGDVAVGAGDGRFTVRLVNFEGPFDLLLQLISKHKLDVTEVALSKVTDEFMAHIRAMGADWDLDQTTEFLVVAATLLDLKAARLLPTAEVEDEGDLSLLEARDLLFARLLQYRAYKRIADIFSERLDAEARRYPRTVGLEPQHAALLPEVVISIGPDGFAKLAVKAMQPRAEPQVYVDHIHAPLVSVREQAEVVVARLREVGQASFQALTEDVSDTLTVVARFLALLELYREKVVVLDQEEALGELMVRWTGGEAAQPVVTDEFDQVVEEETE